MEATRGDHIDPKNIEVVFLDAGGVLLYPDWERVSRILEKNGIAATSAQLADAEFLAKRRMDDAGFSTTTGDVTDESDLPALWKPKKDQFFHVDMLPYLGSGKLDLRALKTQAAVLAGKEI